MVEPTIEFHKLAYEIRSSVPPFTRTLSLPPTLYKSRLKSMTHLLAQKNKKPSPSSAARHEKSNRIIEESNHPSSHQEGSEKEADRISSEFKKARDKAKNKKKEDELSR